MTIRQANVQDLDILQKLFVESIEATCTSDYTFEQIKAWTSSVSDKQKWVEKIKNQYFILVIKEQKVAGFASLEAGNYLDMMYVSPAFQGLGIAKTLLNHILQKSQGTTISTHASYTARPFFENQGFEIVQENHFLLRGVEISNYLMVLNN